MELFEIAQNINLAVGQPNESTIINKEGQKLYLRLKQNTNEIKGCNRHSFHIGSAMYFYKNYIDRENDKTNHKLATLITYVKLYESISYQDLQSLIGAYRLHILLIEEKDFFYPKLMNLLLSSIEELFNDDSMKKISKQLDKLYFAAQYTLFYYCSDDPGMFRAMNITEKEKFEQIYALFKKEHKICKFENKNIIELGIKVLKFLYDTLCEDSLSQFECLGTLA